MTGKRKKNTSSLRIERRRGRGRARQGQGRFFGHIFKAVPMSIG